MKLFVFLKTSFEWATIIKAFNSHFVDEAEANQIGLGHNYFFVAGWAFTTFGSTG